MLGAYYVLAIFLLLLAVLEGLGIIRIEIIQTNVISVKPVNNLTWIIFLCGAIVIGTIVDLIVRRRRKGTET
jgi:hypothetical protein